MKSPTVRKNQYTLDKSSAHVQPSNNLQAAVTFKKIDSKKLKPSAYSASKRVFQFFSPDARPAVALNRQNGKALAIPTSPDTKSLRKGALESEELQLVQNTTINDYNNNYNNQIQPKKHLRSERNNFLGSPDENHNHNNPDEYRSESRKKGSLKSNRIYLKRQQTINESNSASKNSPSNQHTSSPSLVGRLEVLYTGAAVQRQNTEQSQQNTIHLSAIKQRLKMVQKLKDETDANNEFEHSFQKQMPRPKGRDRTKNEQKQYQRQQRPALSHCFKRANSPNPEHKSTTNSLHSNNPILKDDVRRSEHMLNDAVTAPSSCTNMDAAIQRIIGEMFQEDVIASSCPQLKQYMLETERPSSIAPNNNIKGSGGMNTFTISDSEYQMLKLKTENKLLKTLYNNIYKSNLEQSKASVQAENRHKQEKQALLKQIESLKQTLKEAGVGNPKVRIDHLFTHKAYNKNGEQELQQNCIKEADAHEEESVITTEKYRSSSGIFRIQVNSPSDLAENQKSLIKPRNEYYNRNSEHSTADSRRPITITIRRPELIRKSSRESHSSYYGTPNTTNESNGHNLSIPQSRQAEEGEFTKEESSCFSTSSLELQSLCMESQGCAENDRAQSEYTLYGSVAHVSQSEIQPRMSAPHATQNCA